MLYGDETAHIDPLIFPNVIVPIFQKRGTSMIMISTLVDEDNFFTKFFKMKHEVTGKPLFNIYEQTLVCKTCSARGDEFAASCTHRLSERPPWLDPGKLSTIAMMFGKRRDLFLREIQGIIGTNSTTYFDKRHINAFRDRPPYRYGGMDDEPKFIHVMCDPNCGGMSNVALVAVHRVNGALVVRIFRLDVNNVFFFFLVFFFFFVHRFDDDVGAT